MGLSNSSWHTIILDNAHNDVLHWFHSLHMIHDACLMQVTVSLGAVCGCDSHHLC